MARRARGNRRTDSRNKATRNEDIAQIHSFLIQEQFGSLIDGRAVSPVRPPVVFLWFLAQSLLAYQMIIEHTNLATAALRSAALHVALIAIMLSLTIVVCGGADRTKSIMDRFPIRSGLIIAFGYPLIPASITMINGSLLNFAMYIVTSTITTVFLLLFSGRLWRFVSSELAEMLRSLSEASRAVPAAFGALIAAILFSVYSEELWFATARVSAVGTALLVALLICPAILLRIGSRGSSASRLFELIFQDTGSLLAARQALGLTSVSERTVPGKLSPAAERLIRRRLQSILWAHALALRLLLLALLSIYLFAFAHVGLGPVTVSVWAQIDPKVSHQLFAGSITVGAANVLIVKSSILLSAFAVTILDVMALSDETYRNLLESYPRRKLAEWIVAIDFLQDF